MESSATMSLKSPPLPSSSSSFFSTSFTQNPKPKSLSYAHKPRAFKCIQSPPTGPVKKPFTCSAVTFPPSQSLTETHVSSKLHRLISEFQSLPEPIDRVKRLLHYATLLPELDPSAKVDSNRVMGCTAQVWLQAELGSDGKMRFFADSDSEISRGFCSCLVWVLDGAAPEEVMKITTEELVEMNVGVAGKERSRVNTWHNVLITMQKKTKALVAEREGKTPPFEPFPSLVVTADGVEAKGSYAEAQARYLFPDESKVEELVSVLKEKKIGVVAHFYMDPQVQGILTAAQKQWPHIHISDSLVMADSAVKMAKAGCKYITVLGVDFMSENVRAILDQAGFGDVGVYRMSSERIGCSLADAAATPSYMNYLEAASKSPPSLHVIYINTSLETKAYTHELVPTITCTSSNVVQTILQAFSQVPNLNIWYGPDSYMGANIKELFQQMTKMTDEEIAEIHPAHNRDSIRSLLPHLHFYQDGTCIVHHLFGHEVVEKINEMYCDAFLTAHLEVPGEMFSSAMEAKRRGMGVVGSTQNILDFINQRVQEALDRNVNDHLQFVLGTESGMVTAIVSAVRRLLASGKSSSGGAKIKVEIVFPVSSDSMTITSPNSSVTMGDIILPVIPGVASGEGCSIHGGCASCPYMKMNTLSSLLKVCHQMPDEKNIIAAYEAERFKLQTPNGKSVADVGCEPILHMRHFQVLSASCTMGSTNESASAQEKQPLFSFGIISDVQYADIPDGRSFIGVPRYYRHSILVLKRAVQNWNHHKKLKFVINLGDIVDGFCPKDQSLNAVKKVVNEFDKFNGPVYHLIGNHCLYNLPRKQLLPLLKIPGVDDHAYFDFSPTPEYRFVVLDGYDVSAIGWPQDHPKTLEALNFLHEKNPNSEKNSPSGLVGLERRFLMFNGAVGKEQLKWLDGVLQEASNLKQKVVICCHIPLDPGTSSPEALLWNYDQVMDVIHRYNCVKLCLAGHDHKGGYSIDSHGIHHRALEAALECPSGRDAFGHVDVYDDRLSLIGTDRMHSTDMCFKLQENC